MSTKAVDGTVSVEAELVLRAEGEVWRLTVVEQGAEVASQVSEVQAREALEGLGYSVVGARGLVKAAVWLAGGAWA